eukprot:133453-Hanusia_phi.AAC.1
MQDPESLPYTELLTLASKERLDRRCISIMAARRKQNKTLASMLCAACILELSISFRKRMTSHPLVFSQ